MICVKWIFFVYWIRKENFWKVGFDDMDGEKNFQNGAFCVYYTGCKYKRMAPPTATYTATFNLAAAILNVTDPGIDSITNLPINALLDLGSLTGYTGFSASPSNPGGVPSAAAFLSDVIATGGLINTLTSTVTSGGILQMFSLGGSTPVFLIGRTGLVIRYDNTSPYVIASGGGSYSMPADTVTISYSSPTVFPLTASAPALSCSYLTSNLMTVSWPPVTGATSYSYMMAITAPAANVAAAAAVVPSNSTSTSATFRNLVAGNTYSLVMTVATPSGPQVTPALVVTTPAANASFPSPSAIGSSKASPTTIRYKKVVCWGLSPQAVNFAQASTLGHRVAVTIPVDLMNKFFTWTRASGENSPTGRFNKNPAGTVAGTDDFVSELVKAFSREYNDLDGVANGLNFSSTALDMTGDLKRDPCVYNPQTDTVSPAPRAPGAPSPSGVSSSHYGANDLVMAYLMFKCFGSSSYDPTDIIYNVDDAFNMLSSQQLAEVINASLEAEDALANAAVLPNGKDWPQQLPGDNKGQVDAMFRGFLASDPLRYFLNGVQIPGLFETNFVCPPSDPAVHGNWCLTVGDKLEVPLQLVFRAPVTVMSVQDNIQNPSSATPDSATTEIIKGEAATFDCSAQKAALSNVVAIRLQITCAAPSTGVSSGSTSDPTPTANLMAVGSSVVFYTPLNYAVQTSSPIVVAGGVAPYMFSMAIPFGCPTPAQGLGIDPYTGRLVFTPTTAPPLVQWGKFVVKVTVTDSSAASGLPTQTYDVYLNVSIDDGKGASNSPVYLSLAAANAGPNTIIDPASPALNGVRANPLYANISNNYQFVPYASSVIYASPDYASSGADSCLPADATTNKKNVTSPLSYDVITITYTAPAIGSLDKFTPAVDATETTWSITSVGGRSGAAGSLPNGISFTSGVMPIVSGTCSAYLMVNLDPLYTPPSVPGSLVAAPGADYTPGNAAGNVPGEYKFLITSKDKNGYVQSIPVNLNIAVPAPKSALTPLVVTGTAGLSYVNGNTLTYTRTMGGIDDTLTLTNNQGGSNFKWDLVAVGTALVRPTDISISSVANVATVTLSTAYVNAGIYPYLITSLDNKNVVQTIFFTLNIV